VENPITPLYLALLMEQELLVELLELIATWTDWCGKYRIYYSLHCHE